MVMVYLENKLDIFLSELNCKKIIKSVKIMIYLFNYKGDVMWNKYNIWKLFNFSFHICNWRN